MKKNILNKRLTLWTVLTFITLVFGLWFSQITKASADNIVNATVLPTPRSISNFELTDGTNHPFTNQNLQNHWTMLFFGFTNCTSICPTTMSALSQTYSRIVTDHGTPPQVVFISIDPDRDNLPLIQKYATSFNPNFQGATGSKDQLLALTRQLSILYITPKYQTSKNYQIDHSGSILLINPKGQLYAVFSMPHEADSMAKDFTAITSNYS